MNNNNQIDEAYKIASGTFLTECFKKEDFEKKNIMEFISEKYEYWTEEQIREDIVNLAEAIHLALIKTKLK